MNSTLFFNDENVDFLSEPNPSDTTLLSGINGSHDFESTTVNQLQTVRSKWFFILFPAICFLLAVFILIFNAIFSAACWRTRSLRYTKIVNAKRLTALIVGAWCIATAFGSSILFNNTFSEEEGCDSEKTISRNYAWSRFVLFISTALVSGFCHVSIQLTAMRHIRQIHSIIHQRTIHKGAPTLGGAMASSLRLVKTFLLVYVLLLVCLLPGLIGFALGVQRGMMMNLLAILAELNAVLNIFVYVLNNRQFRRAIADLLGCRRS